MANNMEKIYPGAVLNKMDVWNAIMANLNGSFSNPNNNYEDLCLLFEAGFGFEDDKCLRYDPIKERFEVFENKSN